MAKVTVERLPKVAQFLLCPHTSSIIVTLSGFSGQSPTAFHQLKPLSRIQMMDKVDNLLLYLTLYCMDRIEVETTTN